MLPGHDDVSGESFFNQTDLHNIVDKRFIRKQAVTLFTLTAVFLLFLIDFCANIPCKKVR